MKEEYFCNYWGGFCSKAAKWIVLLGCEEMHINEMYLCEEHCSSLIHCARIYCDGCAEDRKMNDITEMLVSLIGGKIDTFISPPHLG